MRDHRPLGLHLVEQPSASSGGGRVADNRIAPMRCKPSASRAMLAVRSSCASTMSASQGGLAVDAWFATEGAEMSNIGSGPAQGPTAVPMGVCGRCSREVRAWGLAQVDGIDTCSECRASQLTRRKQLVWTGVAIGTIFLVGLAVFIGVGVSRAQGYKGSPRESMDQLVEVAQSDPKGVNHSYNLMLYGTTGSGRDAQNGGPVAAYADLVTIRKQLEAAEAEIHQSTGVVQISEYFEFGNLTISTVLGAAKTMEFTDETADTAKGTAVFQAPTVGLNREYTAKVTLTKITDATGSRWCITSLDNPADIIRTYVGG